MRKVLAILLIAVSVFLFAGCGDDKPKQYEVKYIAYVNYFGEVKRYEIVSSTSYDSGRIRLTLKNGSHIYAGNNLVIIEDK